MKFWAAVVCVCCFIFPVRATEITVTLSDEEQAALRTVLEKATVGLDAATLTVYFNDKMRVARQRADAEYLARRQKEAAEAATALEEKRKADADDLARRQKEAAEAATKPKTSLEE